MNTERNCQFCKYYKDGYCENLELQPCYPSKGCGDFSKREALEQEPILDKIRTEIEETYINITYQENKDRKATWGLRKALEIIDKYRNEAEE